ARTQLIAAGVELVAPCPHEDECPMRGSARDWCHFSQRLERSGLHRQLKAGELGYEDEKFSYVVASKLPARKAAARIVRHPTVRKGHIELQLCAPGGLKKETIARSQGEEYRQARKAKWGEEWLR
ncbi:MAG TPA: small ribosomal subunit Rsm22 family protein, partial [Terriglobales bacterium]|nr:small ribosomal subunit Rsm22 family protein [Terriglobales bacterium]